MIRIEFIDGTEETVESDDDTYQYDHHYEMFKVDSGGYWIMYPREYVKSIRVEKV